MNAHDINATRAGIDFAAVNAAAIPALSRLLPEWLPGGEIKGKEYTARNPTRGDRKPGSFSINTATGAWADFATNDAGGDPVSLYAYLHRMSQPDAARVLADKLGVAAEGPMFGRRKAAADASEKPEVQKSAPPKADKTPIVPVPADAPPMTFRHPQYGAPVMTWPYHVADGLAGYVARFDFTGKDGQPDKECLPITYCDLVDGRRAWRSKGFPDPRPLYRLPDFAAKPDAPVIVAEGEKSADAAAILFPDWIATTPPHGAKSPHKADWTALAGRRVIIATDHDKPGQDFGDKVCELARAAGAAEVLHLRPDRLGAWIWRDGQRVLRDGDLPQGWDVADAAEEGWTAATVAEAMNDPAFLTPYFDAEAREERDADSLLRGNAGTRQETGNAKSKRVWPFRIGKTGVEKRIERQDKDTGEVTIEWKWFCSHLEVAADTRSADGEDWGRLLKITDRDGQVKEWAMPMAMLAGDGTAYRERLLSLGLIMAPGRFAREALHEYISTARPPEKARCVNRIGWAGEAFALPRVTFEGKE